MKNDHAPSHGAPPFWRSRYGIGWLALFGVAGWFLWTEHRAHLLGVLPYLLLLACPLMHVFMQRGHHGHGHGHDHGPGGTADPAPKKPGDPS